MRKFLIAIIALMAVPITAAAQQAAPPEDGLMIVPGGDRVVILGKLDREGLGGINIYRKKDGGPPELIGELPVWKRNPNLLTEELTEEEFLKLAEKYEAKTPAEYMHKAATNPGIYISIMTVVPRYPRLMGLYENSYIFIDEDIQEGSTYEYEVKIVSGGAEKVEPLIGIPTVTAGDKIAPAVPSGIQAKQGDSQAALAWDLKKGTDIGTAPAGYFIYRKTVGETGFRKTGFSIPGTGDKVSFVDTNAENEVEYAYHITSVNIVGIESEPSEEVLLKPVDMTPPPSPENLDVVFKNSVVKITWQEIEAEGLSHYNVYRTDNIKEGVYGRVNNENVTVPAFDDSSVPFDGKTYFYAVTSVDTGGNESRRTTAQTVTLPDQTPPESASGVKAVFDREPKSVKLTWEHSPSKDVTAYSVFRGSSEDGIEIFQNLGADVLEFTDEFVKEGETYYYAVNAQDLFSNVSVPKEIIKVEIPDMTPPPTPYNLNAELDAEAGKIKITWNDVKADDFKEYIVYRALGKMTEAAENEGYEKVGTSDKPEFVDETAKKGVLYWYRASQVDTSDNESNLCKPDSEKVKDFNPPAMPEEVTTEFGKEGVSVEWKAVSDDDLAGYNVYLVDLFRFTETKVNAEPVADTKFVIEYKEVGDEGNVGVKVSAVDTSDNESGKTKLTNPE